MRVVFGVTSVVFRRYESYADLASFLGDSAHALWLGESAEVHASFWSAEVLPEYGSALGRIGVILEHKVPVPQCAVAPDGSFFAIGFNRSVAFIHSTPLTAKEHMLNASFFNFIARNNVIVAVHELGCTAFSLATLDRQWDLDTDVIEHVSLAGDTLTLTTSSGVIRHINVITGQEQDP
jgi:hypothetical protein